MATFSLPLPPQADTKFSKPTHDWLNAQQTFLRDIAKLPDSQTFTGRNAFIEGKVGDGPILLAGNYQALLKINYLSSNATDARSGGGNAAIYVQHGVDTTTTSINNVNCGIRVQMQSFQKSSAAVNDCVSGYFGLYHAGVNVGGFGVHVDAYHASTGSTPSTYGMSAEMFRISNSGFTAGFHTRCIHGAGYFDNDYGFLASPSPGGTLKFKSVFSAGSVFTGTMFCDFGLDLRFANCAQAAVYMLDDSPLVWGDNIGSETRRIVGASRGAIDFKVNNVLKFAIEDSGRAAFDPGQFAGTSGGAIAKWLIVADTSGNVYKVHLDAF